MFLQHERTEIRGNRVEPAAVNDACAALLGLVVMRIDHFADPMRLAGEVAVVDTILRARLDERAAVARIRTDGAADDPRLRRDRIERREIAGVRDENRNTGAKRFELLAITSSDRPLERDLLLREVLGDETSGEPGRTEEDEIEGLHRGRCYDARERPQSLTATLVSHRRRTASCTRPPSKLR
jgi:hypothetical protein